MNLDRAWTILTLGVVGGIIYTLMTNSQGVTAFFQGLDNLYGTAVKGTYGRA